MKVADEIWNRAALEGGGKRPCRGDSALAALLYAHGMTMNGGVLHAFEVLNADELIAAQDGYRYFGLSAVADLFGKASKVFEKKADLGKHESKLDSEYLRHISTDSELVQRFERHLASHPKDFAPLPSRKR